MHHKLCYRGQMLKHRTRVQILSKYRGMALQCLGFFWRLVIHPKFKLYVLLKSIQLICPCQVNTFTMSLSDVQLWSQIERPIFFIAIGIEKPISFVYFNLVEWIRVNIAACWSEMPHSTPQWLRNPAVSNAAATFYLLQSVKMTMSSTTTHGLNSYRATESNYL